MEEVVVEEEEKKIREWNGKDPRKKETQNQRMRRDGEKKCTNKHTNENKMKLKIRFVKKTNRILRKWNYCLPFGTTGVGVFFVWTRAVALFT